MSGTSGKSKRKTSKGSRKRTSSRASRAGRSPSPSLVGVQTSLCGLEVARANPFRAPESERVRWTNGTSGLRGTASLRSAALASSLASRLRQVMDLNGSMEYRLTWKSSVMPSGRLIYRLRASARPQSDSAYGGWPTPVAHDDNKSVEAHLAMKKRMGGGRKAVTSLQVMAKLVGWPTPMAADARGSAGVGKRELPNVARMAGWAFPTSRDFKSESATKEYDERRDAHPRGKPLSYQVTRCHGLIMTSAGDVSQVEVASGAALSPEHSRWLQGFPATWARSKPTATPSSPKSQQSS
jgi:hypothetical protein